MEYLLTGASPWQIAEALEVDRSTVYRDINARLKESAANCPHTDNYRQLQRERINALMLRYMESAMNGNLKAFDRVLKLMQHEAKLMGLYKPIQHEVTANITAKTDGMEDMEGMKANGHRPNGKTYEPLPVITKDMTSKEMAEAWAVIRNAPRDHPDYRRGNRDGADAAATGPRMTKAEAAAAFAKIRADAFAKSREETQRRGMEQANDHRPNGNGAANGKATGPP